MAFYTGFLEFSSVPGGQELAVFQKYKWIAAVAGVLLTAVPLLWLTSWLQRQGEAEVAITAQWSVGITELSIAQTVASLNELASRNVNSCQPAHVEMLRRSVFGTGLVKEIAVIDTDGQTLSTDVGKAFAARDVLASAATSDPEAMLDVVRIVDTNERLLRIRRVTERRAPTLAALLRPSSLLPQVSPDGNP